MKRILPYLRYLWQVAAGFRRAALLRMLLGVVRVGLSLAFVWLSKSAIDCATGRIPASGRSLITLLALMVGCMLGEMALSQWSKYIDSRASMQMNNSLSRRLFNVLMTMPLTGSGTELHSGDRLNRMTLNVRTVSSFAISQLPSMVVLFVQLVGSFVFLAWLNPFLALAPVVIMPVCLLAGKLFFRRHRRLAAEIRRGESDMQVSIQEGLQHRLVLRSLECTSEMDLRIGAIQQRLNETNRGQARLSAVSGTTTRLGFILGYLTAFGWGIFSLSAGVITFGTMTAFIQLVSRIQNPIAGLAGYLPSFVATSVAVDRLREIDGPMPPVERSEPMPHAGIRVRNLSFRYEAQGHDVLSSFSHDFAPGSRTMIVGSTGAGKTTLIKLLLGLLRPDCGSIEIYNDRGSEPVSAATLSSFVYVPQGNSLLQGTIRQNLLLAAPEATDSDLAEVLHLAAADFVFALPRGLDTPCHEAGAGLSEGQAQRIAIARALLRPGSIMLLDEFNSALDSATAATLMERIAADRPDATIIVIAHHHTPPAPHITSRLEIHPTA